VDTIADGHPFGVARILFREMGVTAFTVETGHGDRAGTHPARRVGIFAMPDGWRRLDAGRP